jgi:hypothetical protein
MAKHEHSNKSATGESLPFRGYGLSPFRGKSAATVSSPRTNPQECRVLPPLVLLKIKMANDPIVESFAIF